MQATVVFGSLAGVTSVLDAAPYVRDVVRRTTRPHRGTWLIWSVLSILAFSSQAADGAAWSIVMVAVDALCTTLILALSVRRGEGGLSRGDLTILAIATVGVAGWALSSAAMIATIFIVVADTLAIGLMLPKTWRDPTSETCAMYALATVSGVLGALAVGDLDPSLLLFPVYFSLANAFLATVIAVRRSSIERLGSDPDTTPSSGHIEPSCGRGRRGQRRQRWRIPDRRRALDEQVGRLLS